MKKLLGRVLIKFDRIGSYLRREYTKGQFKTFGANSYIGKSCIFTPSNVEIGNDSYIGSNCVFQSSFGTIKIGNHVMCGPGVNIHGGNHKFHEIGRFMNEATQKKQGDDGIIVIEDDCWIGANAIILSNVTVGKGTVIGAGSVVTKSLPPYSIYTGSPEVRLKNRFNKEEIEEHERIMDAR